MATTINSGYANSPKLTANIADHADVNGGRSLVYDGIVDKLNIDTIEIADDFTISGWLKFQMFLLIIYLDMMLIITFVFMDMIGYLFQY